LPKEGEGDILGTVTGAWLVTLAYRLALARRVGDVSTIAFSPKLHTGGRKSSGFASVDTFLDCHFIT
jgi:hypothetical protein